MREGKSGGYRVISIVDKNENELVFLEVYPKKGKFSKDDLPLSEYLNLLKEYLEQALENTLKEVNINDELKVIDKEISKPDSDKEED